MTCYGRITETCFAQSAGIYSIFIRPHFNCSCMYSKMLEITEYFQILGNSQLFMRKKQQGA